MQYIVDMQGFKQPHNDYVLKELAIASLSDEEPVVITFKQPYPWRRLPEAYKKENIWLRYNYHGLSWTSGTHPYTEVGKILHSALKNVKRVLVSDSIRKNWLERFKIPNIEVIDYSSKYKLVTVCSNHDGFCKTKCALHNVKLMREIYINERNYDFHSVV